MNSYDLARQHLNNSCQLEQQLAVTRSELRQLLFLQSQKAAIIQQKAHSLVQAVEVAQRAAQRIHGYKMLDTSLLETTGFALSAVERTADLLHLLCSIPIQVQYLQLQLKDGGFSAVQQQLKQVGGIIAAILQKNDQYLYSAEVNFKYVNQEQLMQIQTSTKQYFKSFNQFYEQMDEWLVRSAPSEALTYIARGYEHFVQEYFEILLYQEKIIPGCMQSKGIWYKVVHTIIDSIGQYFLDFSADSMNFDRLLPVLEQYFIMINHIGAFLDKPADSQLLATYGMQTYTSALGGLLYHDFFPIRRIYAIAIHKHLLNLLKEYIECQFRKSDISVSFIIQIFSFIDKYEKLLGLQGFEIRLFRYPILLKMQQLQTDSAFTEGYTKPFLQVLNQATGSKKLESFQFYSDQFLKAENAAQILLPVAEKVFYGTFCDFWINKTQLQERAQILAYIGSKREDIELEEISSVFYVNALDLSPATLALVGNFEKTIQYKFLSVQQVAYNDYPYGIRSAQLRHTNVAADFYTIFQTNATTATFNHPEAAKIALAVVRQATSVVAEFCAAVLYKVEVAAPYMNYYSFLNQPWRNVFVHLKSCKNQAYANALGQHEPLSAADFQLPKQAEEIYHQKNEFDDLNEHYLVVIANDAYNLYSVVKNLFSALEGRLSSDEALERSAEEYLQFATDSCCKLIVVAASRLSFVTIQQLPLNQLYSESGVNFWFQYRKILVKITNSTSTYLDAFAQKELKRQLYLATNTFEFTAFLFSPAQKASLATLRQNSSNIDEIFRELGIKQAEIERNQRLVQMFVLQTVNGSATFLEKCIFHAYFGSQIDQLVQENAKSITAPADFYSELSALERAVKHYKEG